ncbi:hypothetical protein C9374_013481 [Naegleria lovaniensis]|uniref:Uncharacterized protein n=1 Tax=Naegleria lovaniensis TaxID=51637 RepID=A0AA88H0N1_NAELO|nr:uncharacterized protein C9374_013481 [Naegleria lovaniensis]KAG2391996.1 hypothetical protein C9374_013481 [Naegleria lovaniensis]
MKKLVWTSIHEPPPLKDDWKEYVAHPSKLIRSDDNTLNTPESNIMILQISFSHNVKRKIKFMIYVSSKTNVDPTKSRSWFRNAECLELLGRDERLFFQQCSKLDCLSKFPYYGDFHVKMRNGEETGFAINSERWEKFPSKFRFICIPYESVNGKKHILEEYITITQDDIERPKHSLQQVGLQSKKNPSIDMYLMMNVLRYHYENGSPHDKKAIEECFVNALSLETLEKCHKGFLEDLQEIEEDQQ